MPTANRRHVGTYHWSPLELREWGGAAGITVASVEYRLAPEYPYPTAPEDCYAALTWLTGLPAVDPARVAIGGASAGGGLAAALALLARDRGDVTLALQLPAYPMLDVRSATSPTNPYYRLWNPRSNRFGWTAYLGDADPQVAVPARRDVGGLPRAWIGVSTNDLFHDEDLAYAERLTRAGVACHVEVVPGVSTASTCWCRKPKCHNRSSPASAPACVPR